MDSNTTNFESYWLVTREFFSSYVNTRLHEWEGNLFRSIYTNFS